MSRATAATFHEQLCTLLEAGMPIAHALELAGDAAGGIHRTRARTWAAGCSAGLPLAQQMRASGEAELDVALVEAGELSGRLAGMCREIAAQHRHAIALRTMVIARLAYPLCIVHVALVAAAVPGVFLRGAAPWLLLAGPAALWAAAGAGLLAVRLLGREGWSRVALLRGARFLAWPWIAANACLALRAGLAAGMLAPRALELAAEACGNRVVARRLASAATAVLNGRLPNVTAALRGSGLPDEVVRLAETGEHSGTLDTELGRAAALMRESFRLRSEWAARAACGAVYGLAMLLGVLVVFMLMAGYVGLITDTANQVGE
jgi:type II secretory pathway component PulF